MAVEILSANERFVDDLEGLGISSIVIRQSAFVSDTGVFFNIAPSGRISLFGDGANCFNPSYGAEIFRDCVATLIFFSSATCRVSVQASVLAHDVLRSSFSMARVSELALAFPPRSSSLGTGALR